MTRSPKSSPSTADYLGILSAFVCLLHCLAAPLLMGAAVHMHEHSSVWLWEEWNYLFLGIGLLAVWWSTRHTHQKWMRSVMWLTFGLLATAVILETYSEELHFLIYAASGSLIFAHLVNIWQKFRMRTAPAS